MSERVLLVEDDDELGKQIAARLRGAGFEPTWVTSGDRAVALEISAFRLVILDLMLPGVSGLDVLKQLRSHSDVPVLILSARNDPSSKVRALQLGADDYLTKPFFPEELVERVRARLRRPLLRRDDVIDCGRLQFDLTARTVRLDGSPIELTRIEFDLLVALARKPGAAVSRRWLVDNVLDPDRDGSERTLDVHMSRLRKKLGDARLIATVWGIGYRFEPAP